MKKARGKLTYGNVIATVALFLALSGGVVWAAGKIGSNQIAANAVKARNIARNAVTAVKVRDGSLLRSDLLSGTVSGLPVADASASDIAVPTSGSTAVPIALQGTTAFTARNGQASSSAAATQGMPKELLAEARGTLVATGSPPCNPDIEIDLNGLRVADVAPDEVDSIDGTAAAVGLTQAGQTQTMTAKIFPDPDCAAGSKIDLLRVVVVQYG
jgi:hypothetical protein